VEQGEEIIITRRGKPVAKLVPAGPGFDREMARRVVADLLEASRCVTLGSRNKGPDQRGAFVSFVLDNSVALTWCFEDERTSATTALLKRVGESGAWAPMLWPLEALNGLLVAERRGRLDAPQRQRLAGFLRAPPIKLDIETAS
jgi:hypothetical protein